MCERERASLRDRPRRTRNTTKRAICKRRRAAAKGHQEKRVKVDNLFFSLGRRKGEKNKPNKFRPRASHDVGRTCEKTRAQRNHRKGPRPCALHTRFLVVAATRRKKKMFAEFLGAMAREKSRSSPFLARVAWVLFGSPSSGEKKKSRRSSFFFTGAIEDRFWVWVR